MIWNDAKLREWCEQHSLVTPYDPACINPGSIDLRLGNLIREPHSIWDVAFVQLPGWIASGEIHDLPRWSEAFEFDSYWLEPGEFVLCHSLETVKIPDDAIGVLYSKSSTGRKGLEHLHAGYIDSEFLGSLTFEFHNVAPWPIELNAGQRLMQMTIEDMNAPAERGYAQTGRYMFQSGPTPARDAK